MWPGLVLWSLPLVMQEGVRAPWGQRGAVLPAPTSEVPGKVAL